MVREELEGEKGERRQRGHWRRGGGSWAQLEPIGLGVVVEQR
jgi:hypothetical protein